MIKFPGRIPTVSLPRLTTLFSMLILLLTLSNTGILEARGKREPYPGAEPAHPFTEKDLREILDSRKDVSFIAGALITTGLSDRMSELEGYTLFVPTDDVIAHLPERLQEAMKSDPGVLLEVLTAQMVNGVYSDAELSRMGKVTSMGEIEFTIGQRGGKTTISDSDVTAANLFGRGFVVHIVSGIIVPSVKI